MMKSNNFVFLEAMNDFDGNYEFDPIMICSTIPEAVEQAVFDLKRFRESDNGESFNDENECINIDEKTFREKLLVDGMAVVADSDGTNRRVYRIFTGTLDLNLVFNKRG